MGRGYSVVYLAIFMVVFADFCEANRKRMNDGNGRIRTTKRVYKWRRLLEFEGPHKKVKEQGTIPADRKSIVFRSVDKKLPDQLYVKTQVLYDFAPKVFPDRGPTGFQPGGEPWQISETVPTKETEMPEYNDMMIIKHYKTSQTPCYVSNTTRNFTVLAEQMRKRFEGEDGIPADIHVYLEGTGDLIVPGTEEYNTFVGAVPSVKRFCKYKSRRLDLVITKFLYIFPPPEDNAVNPIAPGIHDVLLFPIVEGVAHITVINDFINDNRPMDETLTMEDGLYGESVVEDSKE